MPVLVQVFSKDVIWRVPGKSALSKVSRGHAEVFSFFGRLMRLTTERSRSSQSTCWPTIAGVFVDRLSAERNGRTLDIRLLLHVTIRDGQIAEGVDCFHHEHLWDEFWVDAAD